MIMNGESKKILSGTDFICTSISVILLSLGHSWPLFLHPWTWIAKLYYWWLSFPTSEMKIKLLVSIFEKNGENIVFFSKLVIILFL